MLKHPVPAASGSAQLSGAAPPLSAYLREQSEPVWAGLHAHPFLRELASGALPLEKFRFFAEQDILYLPDFARCLAMGAAKSTTDSELAFFAGQLEGTIRLELPNQRRLLARVCEMGAADRGGSLGKAPATVAYTSFLLSVAAQGGPIEILAAILPCAWTYAETVARLRIADHPIYRDWVSFYLTGEVLGLVRQMRGMFDELAARAHPAAGPVRRLLEIFMTSSRLEGAFWDMAYTLEQWPRPAPSAAVEAPLAP